MISDSSGTCRVVGLPPGHYEVESVAQGFANEKSGELSLTVAEPIVVKFSLKVNISSESVSRPTR